jgi:hypothetical protein
VPGLYGSTSHFVWEKYRNFEVFAMHQHFYDDMCGVSKSQFLYLRITIHYTEIK